MWLAAQRKLTAPGVPRHVHVRFQPAEASLQAVGTGRDVRGAAVNAHPAPTLQEVLNRLPPRQGSRHDRVHCLPDHESGIPAPSADCGGRSRQPRAILAVDQRCGDRSG